MSDKNSANHFVKDCIVTALIDLMKEKDYDHITITDIADRAGVSRMAYYRNYSSKEDILNQYMESVGESVHMELQQYADQKKPFEYFRILFERLGQHNDIGIAVLKANLGEMILKNVRLDMIKTFSSGNVKVDRHYRINFLAGAFYGVFVEWLRSGRDASPETLAAICIELLNTSKFEVSD